MSSSIPCPRNPLSTSTASPISGRRCWRKNKERTGPVWNPILETAFIEALENYQPTRSRREGRPFARFPKRNQYISDYIFAVTGVRRTSKQVGSRLQQMRDACKDKRILDLIFRPEISREAGKDSETNPSTPSDSSVSLDDCSSTSDTSEIVDSLPAKTFITIELVQPSNLIRREKIARTRSPRPNHCCVSLDFPSHIENNDPILAFSTPRKISTAHHFSYFRVLVEGVLVHSEVTELTFVSTTFTPSPVNSERHTYSAKLIPRYWAQLCRTSQLFQCVIEQDIMRTLAPFDIIPMSPSPGDQAIRSVTYEFSVTRPTAAVFHTPSLASEPALPPEFPAAGYTSRPPTRKPSRDHVSSTSPFDIPPMFYAPDGSCVAPTQDGLFSVTDFQDAISASSTLPYGPCSTWYDFDGTFCDNTYFPSTSPSDSDVWPSTYDTYNPTTNSSIWSEYLELNANHS
ncbi:hypothetical protein C8R45DRAFT_1074793 [Mycena sanguinolenta]|nr:hypothetical protein C8R45DRAFT_1074793 [Mycena sanguinolenta]